MPRDKKVIKDGSIKHGYNWYRYYAKVNSMINSSIFNDITKAFHYE